MPIGDLFGLIQQKKQTSTDKYLASSVNIVSTGEKGQLRPPFSQQRGINSFHSWIYAAAQINANAVASVPIRLYKQADSNTRQKGRPVSRRTKSYLMGDGPGDQRPSMSVLRKAAELGDDVEEVTGSNPVIDLLQNANPFLNGFDLAVLRVLYGELTGNSYLHPIIDPETDQPSELWPLAPQYVEVIPCEDNFIEGYVYGIDAQRKQVFEPDEVIHFRRPNPGNYYYGMGKVEAAFGAVLSNDAVHQMDLSTFANSARPDYAVVVKGTPTGDQLDRFQQLVEERLKGTRKDGNFIAVSGDVQFTPLNFPPKDVAGREEIVEEIAAIFGVPVTMMKANDPNLASAKSGFSQWREGTVLPLCRMDEQELNQSLLPMFGLEDDYFLAYDNPVPKDEAFDLQARQSAVAGGWQTPNEARMEEGRDAIEDPMADSLLYSGQPLGGPQMPGGGGIMPPMGQAMPGQPGVPGVPGQPGEPGEAQAEPGDGQAMPGQPGQPGQGPGQGGQAALNGAQISSVITILDGVASGTIAKEGAVELIMATGVTKESAQRMVSTQATAKPEAQAEAELDANIGPTTPEEKSKIDLATVADVGFLLKQGIISRHVAVKAFQAAGMTRKRAERVSKSEATKANVLRSDDDIYDTCDEAKRIAEGIGCQGCHEHDVGGTTKWMPCSSMEEYEKVATVLESVEKGGGVSGLIPKLLGARMSAAARTALGNNILEKADDCGTGSGGFKPGNDCAEGHGRPEGSKDIPKQGWEVSSEEFAQGLDPEDARGFPVAEETVSGLKVRDEVPNMESIQATYEDPVILDGVREVFIPNAKESSEKDGLAQAIQESGEINPLIVGVDSTGVSIIEGSHRIDSLRQLGVESFPAVVAVDGSAHEEIVRQAVKDGKEVPSAVLDEYGISKTNQTDTPEFKDWFGESKVANWDGTPKVQYHGTQAGEDFSAFRAPKDSDPVSSALFVAPRTWIAEQYAGGEEGTDKFPKNARLIPVYASIQKPYMVGGIDQGITIGELRAEGYDGIVDAAGGYWAAFDPSQLKSSIGNDGSFDADNPDLTKSAKDCGTGAGGFKPGNDCAEGHGRPPKPENIDELKDSLRDKYPLEKLSLYERGDHIELMNIEVEDDAQGQGVGTDAMDEIKDYAQDAGKPIVLTAEASSGSREDLNRFYESLGFESVESGGSRDYSLPAHTHIWKPEESKDKPKTETPEFKEWIGESVEQDDGKPRVLYHGTAGVFDKFSEGVTWVSEEEDHAQLYADAAESMSGNQGGVIPLYVRAERPVKVSDRPKSVKLDTLANELLASARKDKNTFDIKEAKESLDRFRRGWESSGSDTKQERPRHEWWFDEGRANANEKNFASLVQSLGYDSVEYYETVGGYRGMPERKIRTVGVFDSNQLKSSSDNDGNFSRESGDITKSADNCGTGAGGFQPGNDCAEGHGEQSADGVNQEKKDEDLSIDDRLDAHLRNSGNIANFAERLANGELNADDFYDLNGYLSEQMHAAYDAGDNDEGGDWEQHQNDLADEMFTRGLLDDNFEPVNIPSKSEPWPEKRRDVPDFTKVPEAVENRTLHLKHLASHDVVIRDDAGEPETVVSMTDHIRETMNPKLHLQGESPTIHIDSQDLRDALFDGGFFPFGHPDVPRSTNANTSNRESIEWAMGLGPAAGTEQGSPWHDRPVYGAFTDSSWEDFSRGHGGAGEFGNVEVVLKDSVLERATVTFGDSGRVHEDAENFSSSRESYPSPVSYQRIMNETASEDELVAAHGKGWVRDMKENGRIQDSWTEFQVWGGVTVNDIESVRVSPAAIEEDRKTGGRLSQMLTEAGIEIEVAEGDWKGEY